MTTFWGAALCSGTGDNERCYGKQTGIELTLREPMVNEIVQSI
jgi:hypothetical protein